MYHIKDDKRSRRSAERVSGGLRQCLEQKPFRDVTVADVLRASGVGRATFYRLFDNMADVLAYESSRVFREATAAGRAATARGAFDVEGSFVLFVECWMRNAYLIEAVVECGRLDILYDAHRSLVDEGLVGDALASSRGAGDRQAAGGPSEDACVDYAVCQLTAAMVGTLVTWADRGRKESARELFQVMQSSQALIGAMLEDPRR